MITICVSSSKNAREAYNPTTGWLGTGLFSYVIGANAQEIQPLLPSDTLKGKKASLKKSGDWNAEAYQAWTEEYLTQIANDVRARKALNNIVKARRTRDVRIIVREPRGNWETSLRRILTGLLLGAGVRSETIRVADDGGELTADEVTVLKELKSLYDKCRESVNA